MIARIVLAGLILSIAVPVRAESLAEAVARYDRATVAGDVEALGAIVMPDYLLVNSDASVQRKDSYLSDFRVPGFKLDPYRMEEAFSRVHGDAAMTGGVMDLSWILAGKQESRRLRIAHFWVRQQGHWRLSYTQLTRVPAVR